MNKQQLIRNILDAATQGRLEDAERVIDDFIIDIFDFANMNIDKIDSMVITSKELCQQYIDEKNNQLKDK